jgi:hypothetical protein
VAKITIGGTHNNATDNLSFNLANASQMEVNVGDAYDMSKRQIQVIERDLPLLNDSIGALRQQIAKAEASKPDLSLVTSEAKGIADQAEEVAKTKKWQNISLSKLVEFAKKAGEAAIPIVEAATKVVALLHGISAA